MIVWLGTPKAKQLCDRYGGTIISVPRGVKRLRAARNERIIAEAHRPRDELARKYDLTDRHIRRIINSKPDKPKRGTRKGRQQ
jgi:Mor family transcriptional regulator